MRLRTSLCWLVATSALLAAQNNFVNWESPHVHPLAMTPSGSRLLAVNTPDARLEVFDLTAGPLPQLVGSIAVGVDPVTVRALTDARAWVVNYISDTISIVDLNTMTLVDTLLTPDEPSDLVFTNVGAGGTTGNAWVSCSQPNLVARFDLANLAAPPLLVPIVGLNPKAMAAHPNGSEIYVAIQTSGNNTTVLAGGGALVTDVVGSTLSPYPGGPNPPPNAGTGFLPAQKAGNPPPPPVALIVRKDASNRWMDDNAHDWTAAVSGPSAATVGRVPGWDLVDHDVAIINTANPISATSPRFAKGTMHEVMAIAVAMTANGPIVTVVGTEATNEVRFEPNLQGRFVRVMGALINPVNATTIGVRDLNPQLVTAGYTSGTLPQATRDDSLGDPRAVVWESSGNFGWVAGMGSNNVALVDLGGNRLARIEVGSGPTGLALDEPRLRLYVLNKFASSVSVVDALASTPLAEIAFHDSTPLKVKRGRKHLYDTHRTSGLGQTSCASCHIDGTIDHLAWDLGNPDGDVRTVHAPNMDYLLTSVIPPFAARFHPMKGPMTTQTLQDIIGKEPFHWRGDRKGIEEFNGAFVGLLGDDQQLTGDEMQEFEDFLASIAIPPNPFRFKNNDLNTNLDLTPFHLSFHPIGGGPPVLLSAGDARRGLDLFMPTAGIKQDGFHCVTCHSNPVGVGPDRGWNGAQWIPVAAGAHGERHSLYTSADPVSQRPLKIPQLRNMHKKAGFDLTTTLNTAGFGFLHDGTIDTISHFVSEPVFIHTPGNEQQDVADLAAFMLSYAGTALPAGSPTSFDNPPGPPGLNTHAGVGFQWTVKTNPATPFDSATVIAMLNEQIAKPTEVAVVVKQNRIGGGQRGFAHLTSAPFTFQTDAAGVTMGIVQLAASIGPGTEATFTLVPAGTEIRAGVDRDGDGAFDADEVAAGTNPASARSVVPAGSNCTATIPAAPSGVAGAGSTQVVKVFWADNSSNETGFAIERAWTNSPQFELVGEVGPNTTSFLDRTIAPSTMYVYRVRAFNCAGESANAVSGTVTIPALGNQVLCHIHAIDLQTELAPLLPPATQRRAYGTVNVVDDEGRLVKGATVTAFFSGSSTTPPTNVVTNDQGQAFFGVPLIPIAAGQSWTLTVIGISSSPTLSVIYDSARDVLTSNTVQ